MRIRVYVINLSGVKTVCECDDNDSVDVLKERISFKENISKSEFTIIYKSRPIYDLDQTLNHNGILENSTLYMVRITMKQIEQQNMFKVWFPKGVFTSLANYSISSSSEAMFRDALNDLERYILRSNKFKWTLKTLAILIDGVQREMDVFDWRRTQINVKLPQEKWVSPVFTQDRREKIITFGLKWYYINLTKKDLTEGLGENLPNLGSIKSFEDFLQQFRYPKEEDIKILGENGQLLLKEPMNEHFVYDSSSWEKIEKLRSQTLSLKKEEAKRSISNLSEELDGLDNKSKYLKRNYFRPIHELAKGLEKRESTIKTLTIKGELIFTGNLKKLQSIFKKKLKEDYADFRDILNGLEKSNGIECLKFNLRKSGNPEQQLNVAECLLRFSRFDKLRNNLKYLDLSGMNFSSECMNAVFLILENSSLEHLALNNCSLKAEKEKPKINQVDVVDGEIFEKLCAGFAKSNLKSIELQKNNLNAEAVTYLVKKLENCRNLKRLDISKNPCSGRCADDIVHLIQNTGLISLNIADTKILGTKLNNILTEGMGSNSSLEFIGIEPTKKREYKPRAKWYWNMVCCCFCCCWKNICCSGCCKKLLWHFRTKTDDYEEIDKDQIGIANDINERSKDIWKLKQLERNIDVYLTYQATYQDMILNIGAARDYENFRDEQKDTEELERLIQDERNFQIKQAESGATKNLMVNYNTNNTTNDNKQATETQEERNNHEDSSN